MSKASLEVLCKQAQDALQHGQYQEARQYYQQALGLKSDSAEIHYGVATACFLVGDMYSAVYHFKEVIRLDSLRVGAYINLGAVYNRLEEYEEALSILRRGIQLDPNRGEGYYNLGLVYKQMNQLEMAVNAYREAVRLNPRMYDAQYNLGNIYMEKGQFADAVTAYRAALEIRPNWEKGKTALDAALLELAEKQPQSQDQAQERSPSPPVISMSAASPTLDPNRMLDPNIHGKYLRDLHRLIVDTDSGSQAMLDFLQKEVEDAIRALSICILTPKDPKYTLSDQISRFDEVIQQMKQLQDTLQKRILRTKLLSEQVAKL